MSAQILKYHLPRLIRLDANLITSSWSMLNKTQKESKPKPLSQNTLYKYFHEDNNLFSHASKMQLLDGTGWHPAGTFLVLFLHPLHTPTLIWIWCFEILTGPLVSWYCFEAWALKHEKRSYCPCGNTCIKGFNSTIGAYTLYEFNFNVPELLVIRLVSIVWSVSEGGI